MKGIPEFFSGLFDHHRWPPRWFCGYWSHFHGWLYILSDLLIWAAYFTIPFIIISYIRKKGRLQFYAAYIWFAAFIFLCGLTHLIDAAIFWIPIYRVSALARFATAVVSWLTVYYLWKLVPQALNLKGPELLQSEVENGRKLLHELQETNKKLSREKEFNEKILDATRDFITVYNTKLVLIALNHQTEQRLGKSRQELIGRTFLDIFPEADKDSYYEHLQAAAQGKAAHNLVSISKTGRYYETSFLPLFEDSQPFAAMVLARDITETITTENELRELNRELNHRNEKLQKANAELEQFAYVLSHDLQEPLRKIQIFSKMLTESSRPEENSIYLSKIDGSAKRMKNLIEDVLTYSRLGAPTEQFAEVDLNQVLEDAKTDLELMIRDKEVIIESDPLPKVKGVKHQLQQLFYNLLSNSVKYSVEKPHIRISHSVVKDAEGKFHKITFTDNGIGFDPQYREDIFAIFKRLQNRSQYEGTGIGLALVRKIAEGHGGRITAESQIGKGSVFTWIVPAES